MAVIEVSQYSEVEDVIWHNPDVMAAVFVEDWGERHDVYVAFYPRGSAEIYNCVRVGFLTDTMISTGMTPALSPQ